MSTKSSIYWYKETDANTEKCPTCHRVIDDDEIDFHFYNEAFDHDNVYLEIKGQTITITVYIWEVIRHHEARVEVNRPYKVDILDIDKITKKVNERVKAFQNGDTIAGFVGLFQYGPPDLPPEQQVINGIKYLEETLAHHKKNYEKMQKILEANKKK